MVTTVITDTIEGSVARSNDKGFLLAGRDGWLNRSKYADPAPLTPTEGQQVRVELYRAGFVRTVEVLGDAPARSTDPAGSPDRDTRIVREAVLKSAIALLGSGGRVVMLTEVLAVAGQLEAWVSP